MCKRGYFIPCSQNNTELSQKHRTAKRHKDEREHFDLAAGIYDLLFCLLVSFALRGNYCWVRRWQSLLCQHDHKRLRHVYRHLFDAHSDAQSGSRRALTVRNVTPSD